MSLKIALDWTPNTNHTPLFHLSQSSTLSFPLEFISPSSDGYSLSPAKRVINGEVDIALVPSESVLAYQNLTDKDGKGEYGEERKELIAVAALLATDASAIVALKSSGISSPSDLEGKIYASYAAKYEDLLVRQMIINSSSSSSSNSSTGTFISNTPARLDIWPALLSSTVDFTWIFTPWEGLQARLLHDPPIELTSFKMGDYGIEYGYSPVLVVEKGWLKEQGNEARLREFLKGMRESVDWVKSNPEKAVKILIETNPTAPDISPSNLTFLTQSQKEVNEYYTSSPTSEWGAMDEKKWNGFVETLKEVDEGLRKKDVDLRELFTNVYL